ncbi:hypothetical protein [Amorphus orientalis]|uniref:Uncharacterized protein n=1 Tax=Amorphus orientalis TaxID=649198 RepID=A0AAE3VMT8_9HYPH|nr:hypothetical protein [Amorphus orientalis]MDQ0314855.1 hypothetical protein [Amorphus orientalis]
MNPFPTIDPAATYAVKLARVVELEPFRYRPLNTISMSGDTVQKILDAYGEAAFDRCDPE